mmetsp:Transcript_48896/g.158856  ORF Transcript_48896/g.158856 Transcript_48896/m.158856 type:complete len:354 (+) Transcript_48896:892-1953(+)
MFTSAATWMMKSVLRPSPWKAASLRPSSGLLTSPHTHDTFASKRAPSARSARSSLRFAHASRRRPRPEAGSFARTRHTTAPTAAECASAWRMYAPTWPVAPVRKTMRAPGRAAYSESACCAVRPDGSVGILCLAASATGSKAGTAGAAPPPPKVARVIASRVGSARRSVTAIESLVGRPSRPESSLASCTACSEPPRSKKEVVETRFGRGIPSTSRQQSATAASAAEAANVTRAMPASDGSASSRAIVTGASSLARPSSSLSSLASCTACSEPPRSKKEVPGDRSGSGICSTSRHASATAVWCSERLPKPPSLSCSSRSASIEGRVAKKCAAPAPPGRLPLGATGTARALGTR